MKRITKDTDDEGTAAHPDDVVKLVLSEAPIPDPTIYTFPSLTPHGPGLWWFGLFAEKDGLAEELMAGRELQWVTGFMPTSEVVKGAVGFHGAVNL